MGDRKKPEIPDSLAVLGALRTPFFNRETQVSCLPEYNRKTKNESRLGILPNMGNFAEYNVGIWMHAVNWR